MKIRENTCINSQEIRGLSRSYFTVDQHMGGNTQTSTHVVTIKVRPSPYLRSKMGTALAVLPKLSGHRTVNALVILLPCSSTSPTKGASHTHNKQTMRSSVTMTMDLALMEVFALSQQLLMNHLMVIKSVHHGQINLVIRSPLKPVRTC